MREPDQWFKKKKDAINQAMPRTVNDSISETVHFILVHFPEHPSVLKKKNFDSLDKSCWLNDCFAYALFIACNEGILM